MSQRGSIRKRGETWTAYWWTQDPEGKRRQRTKGGFRRKADAQAHLTAVLSAVQTGTYMEPRKMTVAVFLRQEWLPTLTQKATTQASYRTTCESWIIPYLGGTQLAQLSHTCRASSTSCEPPAAGSGTALGPGQSSTPAACSRWRSLTPWARGSSLATRHRR